MGLVTRKITLFLLLFCSVLFAENNQSIEIVKAFTDENETLKALVRDINFTAKVVTKVPEENIPTREDFEKCQVKINDAFIFLNGVQAVAISPRYAISFQKPRKFVKYDPFYGIYLMRSDKNLFTVKRGNDRELNLNSYLASIDKKYLNFGKFDGFENSFGKTTFGVKKGSLIIEPCNVMHGIGYSDKKFLTNAYFDYLMNDNTVFNGYAGADFYARGGKVYIKNVDLYYKNLKFCPNDMVVSVNGVKITSKSQLVKIIRTSQKGKILLFKIKRGGVLHDVKIKVGTIPKYSISSRTYLEKIGMNFNSHLSITSVKHGSFAQKSGLKRGDRLMQINFKNVKSITQLRNQLLFGGKKTYQLLFTRHDFQFFVRFDRNYLLGEGFVIPTCPAI